MFRWSDIAAHHYNHISAGVTRSGKVNVLLLLKIFAKFASKMRLVEDIMKNCMHYKERYDDSSDKFLPEFSS